MVETATKLPVKKSGPEGGQPMARQAMAQFDGLRREIDRIVEEFGRGFLRLPMASSFFRTQPFMQSLSLGAAPAMDVVESEKAYRVTAELPGLDTKDIEVKLNNGTLTIRGEKKSEREETQGDYRVSERQYGTFERSFAVPEGVDRNAIEANFEKGVLTLTLPKTPESHKPSKTIEVKAA